MIELTDPGAAVEAYRAVAERAAGGAEVRAILDVVPTPELLQVEMCAVRVIWAARDIRHEREEREKRERRGHA